MKVKPWCWLIATATVTAPALHCGTLLLVKVSLLSVSPLRKSGAPGSLKEIEGDAQTYRKVHFNSSSLGRKEHSLQSGNYGMQLLGYHLSFWWLFLFIHFYTIYMLELTVLTREESRQDKRMWFSYKASSFEKNAEQELVDHRPSLCHSSLHCLVVRCQTCCSLPMSCWLLLASGGIWVTSVSAESGLCKATWQQSSGSQWEREFVTGGWNTAFHTSAHRWQPLLVTDDSSFIDYPLSDITQRRVALSAMTHVPLVGKT